MLAETRRSAGAVQADRARTESVSCARRARLCGAGFGPPGPPPGVGHGALPRRAARHLYHPPAVPVTHALSFPLLSFFAPPGNYARRACPQICAECRPSCAAGLPKGFFASGMAVAICTRLAITKGFAPRSGLSPSARWGAACGRHRGGHQSCWPYHYRVCRPVPGGRHPHAVCGRQTVCAAFRPVTLGARGSRLRRHRTRTKAARAVPRIASLVARSALFVAVGLTMARFAPPLLLCVRVAGAGR